MMIKPRLISLAAGLVLILAFAGQGLAAVIPFTDLADVPAKEKILALQEKGLVRGVGGDRFAPEATITAAQSIQLLVNAYGMNLDAIRFIKEPKATDYFPRANNDAWYAQALIVAAVNGLELPADLDPRQHWTRQEFTYHLIQGMESHFNLPMIKLVPAVVADQDQMNPSYDGAIQRALVYGVVVLDDDGKFHPQAKISRAEAAEQIYNALDYLKAHRLPDIIQ